MATHSSTLAWKIPWTEEPGSVVHGVAQSQTRLKRLSSSSRLCFHPLCTPGCLFDSRSDEECWLSDVRLMLQSLKPRVLSSRDGEPDGLPSMGSHRVGHGSSDLAAAVAAKKADKHHT